MKLKVGYDKEVDVLTIGAGLNIATSASVDFGLIADYGNEEGRDVVGIELLSAGKLIAPFCALNPADRIKLQEIAASIKSLKTNYDEETDILTIKTSRDVEFSFSVGENLIAYMGYENAAYQENYDVVGIELRNASKLLSPWFSLNRPEALVGADSN